MPDKSALKTALLSEDDIGKAIRTHILIEHLIVKYIHKSVESPLHLRKIKIDFFEIVTLALSLGFSEYLEQPLRSIGKIRNNFAHNSDMHINKNTLDNFYSTFPLELRTILTKTLNESGWLKWGRLTNSEKFFALCFTLYVSCEHELNLLEIKIKESALKNIIFNSTSLNE